MTLTNLTPHEQALQHRLDELRITNENAQAVYDLARNPAIPTLPETLRTLEDSIKRQAALDIIESISETTLTATQIRSVFFGAMLKRTTTLDYAYFEMLFYLLKTIRDEALAQIHPANYTDVSGTEDKSFLRMAEAEAGIAPSVASDVMVLGEIIMPYIDEELGIGRAAIWHNIQKTNLRNMIPVLRVMINQVRETGDDRRPNNRILENAAEVQARWMADQENIDIAPNNTHLREMTPEQQQVYLERVAQNRLQINRRLEHMNANERVRGAVEWLINHGETMPTREFAQLVGNRNDDPFDAFVVRNGAIYHMAATLTEEQWANVQRVMRNRMNYQETESIQELLRWINGGH